MFATSYLWAVGRHNIISALLPIIQCKIIQSFFHHWLFLVLTSHFAKYLYLERQMINRLLNDMFIQFASYWNLPQLI